MKKTFRLAIAMFVCLSALTLTGCKDTSALKTAVEEAAKSCPITLTTLGEATGITMGEEMVEFAVNPLPGLVSGDKVDKNLIAKYLAFELQRSNPELFKLIVDNEFGLKCNLNAEGQPIEVQAAADEVKRIHGEFLAAQGNYAPLLLQLYNQQIGGQLPMDIAEGLKLNRVRMVSGSETFFIGIDEKVIKFDDLRNKIVKSRENVDEKIKNAAINLSMLLPVLDEMKSGLVFRYATKSGTETYMEISPEEIHEYLNKASEETAE